MRVLLFTGKGGVGKTTIAAATALHAARCGVKALVVSVDPAHSLGDCLGVPVGPEPAELPDGVAAGLSAVQVDVRARAERSWRTIADHVVGILDAVGVDPVAAEEITVLPGAEEILGLLEVRDLVAAGGHDLVVVDCAPTSETLRLLALPEAFGHYLEAALPVERRILRALATGARAAQPGREPGRDHVVEAAERLRAELDGVREVLTAPGTSVRLVLTPESVVIAEARRLYTALALHGHRVDEVVANRLVPGDGDDPWRSGFAREQAERLAECEASFAPAPVVTAPYLVPEPVGPLALAGLGERLYGRPGEDGGRRLLAPPDDGARLRVERTAEGFVLVLPLPMADRSDVDLARLGDDLRLVVGGHRRLLTLPSALRRCVVTGARLADGMLQVRFRPDPALWRSP